MPNHLDMGSRVEHGNNDSLREKAGDFIEEVSKTRFGQFHEDHQVALQFAATAAAVTLGNPVAAGAAGIVGEIIQRSSGYDEEKKAKENK